MVLWICVGAVVLGLLLLAVLLFDLKGKLDRLQRSVTAAQQAIEPQVEVVRAFAAEQRAHPSAIAAPTNHLSEP